MLKFVFGALWFMLPSYIANIAPAMVKKVKFLGSPIDFGKSWRGKRIFGDHKTWRGLVFGTVSAVLLSLVQGSGVFSGFILGVGTLFGDLWGSFFKRRLSIPSGGKNLPIDEIPGTLTALVFAAAFGVLTISFYQAAFLILAGLPLHVLANRLWHKLGLKEVPW